MPFRLRYLAHDFELPEGPFVIGRSGDCQLSLDDPLVSRRHATLQVRNRNIAFNDALREECGQYAQCRFDDYAVFNHPFSRSDVSKLDYFHPSLSGQRTLAAITWSKTWWN